MRINNNLMAMNTHRQLGIVTDSGAKATEKLSSGFRINRAGDDAAGLSISEKMRGQIRGLNMASRNAQDGISLIQTAEGALQETHAILQRMRELAVQSANDTNVEVDREAIQGEIDELAVEITRIADTTEFNTQNLLGGEFKGTFHVGANAKQNLTISINAMDASSLGVTGTRTDLSEGTAEILGIADQTVLEDKDGNQFAVKVGDDYYKLSDVRLNSAGDALEVKTGATKLEVTSEGETGSEVYTIDGDTAGIDVTTQEMANGAITSIQMAIDSVSAERSKLGAVQNRLEHTIKNLDTSAENLQASESRIRDVDMAQEMMEFTKQNILQQASTAMLAQANVAPQSVLQLLQ